ncbi:MAG: DegV family protein [Erysipelotrichaceae bacterium]|nr:DegV family protein [Erysipelotrichaceae bacterium]
MKIAVVTDTGSNMINEGIAVDGIYCLPLQISDQDKTYLESHTISIQETYQLVKEGHMLKTSLPPLGKIEDLFALLIEEGYEGIFAVPICKGLSGTIGAMEMIAKQLEIPFLAVDCYSTAHIQLTLALKAREMLDQGYSMDQTYDVLQKAAKDSCTFIVPNDLQHLSRSGRLTKMAATLGGLLKIKPILYLNEKTEGRIDAFSKVRTMSKAWDVIIEEFKKMNVDEYCTMCVAHVCDEKGAKEFIQRLEANFPGTPIKCVDLISVVGVHTGIGCIGIQYIRNV